MSVDRSTRNGTYIHFKDSTTNTIVQSFDCGWAPEVTYTGYTISIRFPVAPWIPGYNYYVMFDSGVASGTEFCGPESAPITDPSFWFFNIWNPDLSSTGTTSTTPATARTITTRGVSTTTPDTQMTTTGIVVTTQTTVTTTTVITTSTSTSTTRTTQTTATTTSTVPSVTIITPSDFEKLCRQPVIIGTVVSLASMLPIHALGMYAAFIKFSNLFNPAKIQARLRHKQRIQKFGRH